MKGYITGILIGLVASPIYLAFLDVHLSFLDHVSSMKLSDWSDIGAVVGALVTAGAVGVAVRQLRFNKDLEYDKVVYELIQQGYKDAYDFIADDKKEPVNSRALWIRSARWLVEVQELGQQLKTSQYKLAEEFARDSWRSQFYGLLKSDPKYLTLRPQFFYGIDQWKDENLHLDQAAELSGGHCVGSLGYKGAWEMFPDPQLRILEPRSIDVICRFALPPKDKSYRFDQRSYPELKEWEDDFRGVFEGAALFLKHDLEQIRKEREPDKNVFSTARKNEQAVARARELSRNKV